MSKHGQLFNEWNRTAKAQWLRSEIETLEGMKIDETPNPHIAQFHPLTMSAINHTLTSIITRYKEELLELDEKEV